MELAKNFVIEPGLSHADIARMPGISRAGVSRMLRRRRKSSLGYHACQDSVISVTYVPYTTW